MKKRQENPAPIAEKQDKTRTFGYLKQQLRTVIPGYCANCDSPVKPQSLKDRRGYKNAKN